MVTNFKFTRVDDFLDDMNREDCFDTRDMDGITPNYRFVLASNIASSGDIEDCIDEDGTLDLDVVTLVNTIGVDDGFCALLWGKGVNGERSISIANSTVSYDLGDVASTQIKAIFLVAIADGTGYVMAYCILDKPLIAKGSLILPTDGLVWSMHYGR